MIEKLIIYLLRSHKKTSVDVDAYNHLQITLGNFQIRELSENTVTVSNQDFYLKIEDNYSLLLEIVKGIK